MKLILGINQLNEAPENLLKQAGFSYLIDKNSGEESFVRPLNRGYYPRFHLYLNRQNGKIIFNLHLDQKQASYAGARAHNAEYDGETVEAEMTRIKNLVIGNAQDIKPDPDVGTDEKDVLDIIRPMHFEGPEKAEVKNAEKKSWWRFWK